MEEAPAQENVVQLGRTINKQAIVNVERVLEMLRAGQIQDVVVCASGGDFPGLIVPAIGMGRVDALVMLGTLDAAKSLIRAHIVKQFAEIK